MLFPPQKYFMLSAEDADAGSERALAVLSNRHASAAPLEFVIEPPSTLSGAEAEGKGAAGLLRRTGTNVLH